MSRHTASSGAWEHMPPAKTAEAFLRRVKHALIIVAVIVFTVWAFEAQPAAKVAHEVLTASGGY